MKSRLHAICAFALAARCACALAATNAIAVSDAELAAEAFMDAGLESAMSGDYAAALKSFTTAAQRDPLLAEAQFNIGACHERFGLFDEGRPFYEKAVALAPSNARFRFVYGTALGRNGDITGAVEQLCAARQLEPRNAEYLYNAGVAFAMATQFVDAVSCFESAAEIITNNSAIWFNLGLARLCLGQTNSGAAAFSAVDTNSPVAAQAQYHLAVIAAQQGSVTEAIRHATLSSTLDPLIEETRWLLAGLRQQNGEYQAAAVIFDGFATTHPGEDERLARFYADWAAQAEHTGAWAAARIRYEKAQLYQPRDPRIHMAIARCASALGDTAGAHEALDRAARYADGSEAGMEIARLRATLARRAPPLQKHETAPPPAVPPPPHGAGGTEAVVGAP
ncbi:tetratricopeptide repeat protein [bacterium]|nr:tetratricopeptide repeat protein [bacterium]